MARQGPGHGQAGRHPARQPRGRDPGRQEGPRPRGPDQGRARRSTSATPQLWTRVNALESPWVARRPHPARHRDRRQARGDHGPQGRGALGHPLRRPPARPARGEGEARAAAAGPRDPRDLARRGQPRGDRHRQPAHAGDELRPRRPRRLAADEDDPRRRRPPRLPRDRGPRIPRTPRRPRATAQQDPWHYSIARMVDACTSAGILPFYGPYGDIKDTAGCETQFRAAFLLGCVGAWSLHPVQIEIAKKVFSPPPEEVKFAKKVLEAIPDGRGVHMIDGKMQDDATWKQCKVMVELAEMLAKKDPELAEAYGMSNGKPLRRPRSLECPSHSGIAGPLQRVRPAGRRLQRQLPDLLRPHHDRALARARRLPGDGRRGRRHGRRRGDGSATWRRCASTTSSRCVATVTRLGETSMTHRDRARARRRARRRGRAAPRLHRGGRAAQRRPSRIGSGTGLSRYALS